MVINASCEVDALLTLEDTWTVWQFARIFWLLKSRPENEIELEEFECHKCFQEY